MRSFYRIGGVTLAVDAAEPSLTGASALAAFAVPPSEADLDVEVAEMEAYTPPDGPLLFDSGSVWTLYEDGGRQRIECRSPLFGPDPYKYALVDRDLRKVVVHVRAIDAPPADPLEFPLDELLVNAVLTRAGGVEIHSCGLVDEDGCGYLFAANSGGGKTTTARLWSNEPVSLLSDDRIIVRRDGSGWWMYGTPWHGEAEISSPARARLRRVFLLEKSEANSAEPLTGAAAVARLFSCAFPPFHDPGGVGTLVESLGALTADVPVDLLSFRNDPSAVEFVRDLAAGRMAAQCSKR